MSKITDLAKRDVASKHRSLPRSDERSPAVVMTRTPLRVSFAGGGTDLPDFYELDGGAVLSAAVDKYVYVTVKRHSDIFNEPIRVNYSRTEQVNTIDEIENNIARECLRFLSVEPPIYISTVADMPASTGMGGSSAFTVGLLHALHAFRGERVTAGQLADEACYIEMEVLDEPIGKQDQYAAAFGGANFIEFLAGDRVIVNPLRVPRGVMNELEASLVTCFTGVSRRSEQIIEEQQRGMDTPAGPALEGLHQLKRDALEMKQMLLRGGIRGMAEILNRSWIAKKGTASGVSSELIEQLFAVATANGAMAGKVSGAGGGGFIMFLVPPEQRLHLIQALNAAGATASAVHFTEQGAESWSVSG
jgi:D-glycero-alpha-D-manno-heptose-7-phosphate kinase